MRANQKLNKRGQVIIFVILGIVLLVVVAMIFFVLKPKTPKVVDSSDDYEKVFYLANSCAEIAAKKAVWTSANKGFYDKEIYSESEVIKYGETFYNPLNSSEMYLLEQIRPVYLDEGQKKMPSINNAERSISNEFNILFKSCIEESNISVQFEKFDIGETKSVVEINNENVLFEINPLIKFENKGVQSSITSLTYSLDYSLKKAYESAESFIEEQSKNEALILSYLSILTKENNFIYNIMYENYNTAIFEFVYTNYEPVGGQDLILGFVVKYDWAEPAEILI